jgi:O-antigen ligase
MGRLENYKVLSTVVPQPNQRASRSTGTNHPVAAELAATPETKPNFFQEVCFIALCAYLLSGFVNELALRLIHGKAYISTVTLVLLPGVFLLTGSAFRGLGISFGKWWIAFGLWLAICSPFSVWKSDTAQLLLNFYFRSYLLYFVICACVLTLPRLRQLVYVLGAGNLLVVISCFAFGYTENGRFSVPESHFSFFANANALGQQLLLGITTLLFPLYCGGKVIKVLSAATIALSAVYMLKTGSRGAFVAALVVLLAFFFFSRSKMKLFAVVVPLVAVVLVVLPPETRHRLTNISMDDNPTVPNGEDSSALASQLQRTQLFWDSVWMTLQHPIVGVGPGQFVVEDVHESEEKGERGAWRQTHNSYTQVSSEAGLPGFIFFVCSMLACFRVNFRIYRQTVDKGDLREYAVLSLCMLLCWVGYAVGAFFDHLAYTSYLPIMAGVTTAIYFSFQLALRGRRCT